MQKTFNRLIGILKLTKVVQHFAQNRFYLVSEIVKFSCRGDINV